MRPQLSETCIYMDISLLLNMIRHQSLPIHQDYTPATNLLKKIVSESEKDLILPALKWGRKMEPIAKKRYKAFSKLKCSRPGP
jgi:hypothetical protein